MGQFILAHDLGTSGNKATLFSIDGKLIHSMTAAYPLYAEGMAAEQDAWDWWYAVCDATRALLAQAGVSGDEVLAVSFSGQMMACLPVDRDGKPLRRAMIWADRRANAQAHALREKIDDTAFYQITGHHNIPSYGIQKAMWFKEHEPELYASTWKFLNAKDFVVLQLTGQCLTDVSDANSMACFDLAKLDWSERIVEASGICPDKLPRIVPSTHLVGTVTQEAARLTGLSTATKVIMGAGDGVAANVGAGSVAPGNAYCCLGTSAWVAGTSEKPVLDPQQRIVCWAHAVPGLYSPNGTMQYAGGSYAWMKNVICLNETMLAAQRGVSPYELIGQEIGQCEPGAGGVLFLPYLMGERAPRWNNDARGVFFGLSGTTTRPQLLRSVLEGVVMNLGICFDVLREHVPAREITLIGGAARSEVWQRTIADIFQADVCIPNLLEEANSLGAAVIAGVGAGIYPDFSVVSRYLSMRDKVLTNPGAQTVYAPLRRRFDQVYSALKPLF